MNKISKIKPIFLLTFCFVFSPVSTPLFSFPTETPTILPLQKQAEMVDQWLKIRLDTVLPEIMKRENIDMWIVICREYNEDPVFLTLVPSNWFAARRNSILVFSSTPTGEKTPGVERLILSRRGIGDLYKAAWTSDKIDQWQCLAEIVTQHDPKRIGINESDVFAFGDGLSASLKKKLTETLGPKYSTRLTSAQNLALGWLEKRIPQELEIYPQIVSIAHGIIKEAFSNDVIKPGITSTSDVEWRMREKISGLGLKPWFHPSVDFQRKEKGEMNYDREGIINRGDLLHCDIGITYLRLNTDSQEMAYVLREGETDAPDELKKALTLGNRLQDIFTGEFKAGRTGNEVLLSTLAKARSEGLNAQVYTHPVGFHGHGAGPTIGLWDQQRAIPGQGDYPLFYDTCYAVELNIRTAIPHWNNREIRIALEEDAAFSEKGVYYLDGRQTTLYIIK